MGGIGKSTLATALFDELNQSSRFYRSSFVGNIRERVAQPEGTQKLQCSMLHGLASCDKQPIDAVEGDCLPCT
jgi:hypothetical protein